MDDSPHIDRPATAPNHPHNDPTHGSITDSFTGRVSTLHEIALQIDAARSRDDIMKALRNEVRWVLPHEVCFVCLVDQFRTHYTMTVLSDHEVGLGLDGRRLPMFEGVAGAVIQNQSPLITDLLAPEGEDLPGGEDTAEALLRAGGMRSLLVVPLRTGGGTMGALAVAAAAASSYREQELVLAQLLATQIGIALQNTAMFDDAKKRIEQIELVNELAQDLTSTLELDELLSIAAETIRKNFNYFDVSIFLVDRVKKEARVVAHSGVREDFLAKGYVQKFSEGVVGWTITNEKKALIGDVSGDSRYIANVYRETKSELAIPIRVEHEIVGVLNVEDVRPQAFDQTDAIVLETLCDQIGGAIRNAQLYERLKQTNVKLTELDRMKSDFLGIVSHDFRSPLSSIILAAQSLLKRTDAPHPHRLSEYLKVIVDQANKLILLAEETLSITRMEAGQLNYLFNMVNLERLVKDTVATVNLSTRHSVAFEIDPHTNFVRGDQSKLRQVLQNLVSNAVKYSPRGGHVMIRTLQHTKEQLVVAITDEGIGIPQDQISRLFQKFSRVDSPEARDIKGSGLGLWICKEIVKAHGGHIWVESQPGKGSTFAFTLKKAHPESVLE